ncbi:MULTISPECIES: hypothetical protein [Enterobacter cloacae complex]|uniref:hypothetical protein n=1 Tax=Enterobacter cloacae complex TaxID=354276 RepID=UPI00345AB233
MNFIHKPQTIHSVQNTESLDVQEFNELITELSKLGFTHSSEVSECIVKNNIGNKYKNISGILQMTKYSDKYLFDGGFPPDVYGQLCRKLKLKNKGLQSRRDDLLHIKASSNRWLLIR